MSEQTLQKAITETIKNWCHDNGGFPVAFIAAVDFIDNDGKAMLSVSEMEQQPTHRSLGLSTYLDQWYRDDAQNSWTGIWNGSGDCDD